LPATTQTATGNAVGRNVPVVTVAAATTAAGTSTTTVAAATTAAATAARDGAANAGTGNERRDDVGEARHLRHGRSRLRHNHHRFGNDVGRRRGRWWRRWRHHDRNWLGTNRRRTKGRDGRQRWSGRQRWQRRTRQHTGANRAIAYHAAADTDAHATHATTNEAADTKRTISKMATRRHTSCGQQCGQDSSIHDAHLPPVVRCARSLAGRPGAHARSVILGKPESPRLDDKARATTRSRQQYG